MPRRDHAEDLGRGADGCHISDPPRPTVRAGFKEGQHQLGTGRVAHGLAKALTRAFAVTSPVSDTRSQGSPSGDPHGGHCTQRNGAMARPRSGEGELAPAVAARLRGKDADPPHPRAGDQEHRPVRGGRVGASSRPPWEPHRRHAPPQHGGPREAPCPELAHRDHRGANVGMPTLRLGLRRAGGIPGPLEPLGMLRGGEAPTRPVALERIHSRVIRVETRGPGLADHLFGHLAPHANQAGEPHLYRRSQAVAGGRRPSGLGRGPGDWVVQVLPRAGVGGHENLTVAAGRTGRARVGQGRGVGQKSPSWG